MKKLTILLFSILISFNSYGDIYYGKYNEVKNSAELTSYLAGVENGVGWINALLEDKGQKALFCQPKKLALNSQTIKDILKREVKNLLTLGRTQEEINEYPIAYIIIQGLIDAFPCE
jgi:hypothetical protein